MNKIKKGKINIKDDLSRRLTSFTLPEKLSDSYIPSSYTTAERRKANWDEIVEERAKEVEEIYKYEESKKNRQLPSIFKDIESEFMVRELFPCLLPSLEKTIKKAIIWKSLEKEKKIFNGIDQLAELLWNCNPKRNDQEYIHIFNMPWVREHLKDNPRKFYPKSAMWTEDYAAKVIQKNIRKFFVVKDPEVNEMRNFWKKLEFERENPSILSNPMFAKSFAANWDLTSPRVRIGFEVTEEKKKSKHQMTAKSILNIFK